MATPIHSAGGRTSVPDGSDTRRITFSSNKGGVGKTSLAATTAGLAAERGYRVLMVDLDPQANLGLDLGYHGTDVDDKGEALFEALALERPLRVTEGIRENLDVVVGGNKIEMLAYMPSDDPTHRMATLRRALQPLWPAYDLVIVDSPPLVKPLREMALAASQYVIIPTRGDSASVTGVTGIAGDFARVRDASPELELLGVALFGLGSSSKAVRAAVRDRVGAGLGTIAPVFEHVIRHVESPAVNARNRGMLVQEYARELRGARSFTERKKADSAQRLADDYAGLTAEVLTLIEHRRADVVAPTVMAR